MKYFFLFITIILANLVSLYIFSEYEGRINSENEEIVQQEFLSDTELRSKADLFHQSKKY